jgi:hypothetical protein
MLVVSKSTFLNLFISKQEPVKTKFPQLLYETKIYKILNGGSKFI